MRGYKPTSRWRMSAAVSRRTSRRAVPSRTATTGGGQTDADDRLHGVTHDDGLRLRFTRGPRAARRPLPAVRGSDRFRVFVVRHISMVGTPAGAGKGTHTLLTDRRPLLTQLMRAASAPPRPRPGANGLLVSGR